MTTSLTTGIDDFGNDGSAKSSESDDGDDGSAGSNDGGTNGSDGLEPWADFIRRATRAADARARRAN
eukprot:7908121-Pyramimonas_sp.AAC.1